MTRDEYNSNHRYLSDEFVSDMLELLATNDSCTEDCALDSWLTLCQFKRDLDDLYSDYKSNQA